MQPRMPNAPTYAIKLYLLSGLEVKLRLAKQYLMPNTPPDTPARMYFGTGGDKAYLDERGRVRKPVQMPELSHSSNSQPEALFPRGKEKTRTNFEFNSTFK